MGDEARDRTILAVVLASLGVLIGLALRRGPPERGSWLYPDPDRWFYHKKIHLYVWCELAKTRFGCLMGAIIVFLTAVLIATGVGRK